MRHGWIFGLVTCAVIAACSAGANHAGTGTSAGGGGSGASGSSQAGTGGKHTTSSSTGGSTGTFNIPDASADTGCADAAVCAPGNCGKIPDGCGGLVDCGICAPPDTCGGAGVASMCGTPCTPTTCMALGYNCGMQGDGCGGTLDCGTCTMPDTCGGAGMPSVCGHTVMCTPATCASLMATCGMQGDGCGNSLDCGTCGPNTICMGTPQTCVATCTPATCGAMDCGPKPDGCGGLLACGGCSLPNTCGGLTPGQCGIPASCTGLCLQQMSCSSPTVTTTISGTVYAPNGIDPLPNVLVYVPNGGPPPTYGVQPFTPGVACEQCSDGVTGSPLVSAATDTSGNFQLQNVPVGSNIPLVIQTGRWRRQVTLGTVTACQDNPAPAAITRLPKNKGEGDIPHMAFVTGAVDSLKCVMRKIGVDDAEFTQPSGTGRINLYVGDGSVFDGVQTDYVGGANAGAGTPSEPALVDTPSTLDEYDLLFFPCKGAEITRTAAEQTNLINYANAGGRIFATHFSYVWLFNDAPFNGTANWNINQCDKYTLPLGYTCKTANGYPPNQTGYINTGFPKGLALAEWLQNIGASTTQGQIPLAVLRWDTNNPGAVAPSQEWMQIQDAKIGNVLMHYTFNTPVGAAAANQCGRVLFDDFHVENHGYINANSSYGETFPSECACFPDGGYCESNVECCSNRCDLNPNSLTYETCLKAANCLEVGGACTTNAQCCGGSCKNGACAQPMTPQEKLLEFMIFDLGSCVTPDVPMCTPLTCGQQNIGCGPAGDGCGNVLDCGMCPSGQTCGGGGTPSMCGAPSCTPITCAAQNIQCGPAGDGCGNLIQCGNCPSGTCGGGGMPGVCGAGTCMPTTCAAQNIQCGPAGDGCGNQLSCGTCPAGQTCGGGGKPGVCGSTCVPKTCVDLGFNCGAAADGCGNQLNCGTCSPPQTCGGGGKANVCGGGIPT